MRAVLIMSLLTLFILPAALSCADRGIRVKAIEELTHGHRGVGTYRALIIGINDYQDKEIPDLETAVADATAMADLLQKQYGFQIDHQKDILLDRKATRGAIYNALRTLTTSSGPSDSVLIYFAGHGDLDNVYHDGWWIPADAKAGDPLTYFDNGQVQRAMGNMPAKHVLLISDSCYSGTLFGKSRALPPVIDDKYYLGLFNEKSRWGMTSGNKTPVADSGTDGHSIFAYQLLKALRKNEKPYFSVQELYDRIAPIIGNNSDQMPMCNPIKNIGDQGGRFIFIASSGAIVDEVTERVIPPKTLLSIESNITDAKIYVDGRYIGSTPLKKIEITSGHHRVRVQKEGFQPYQREVKVTRGWTKTLTAILDPSAPAAGRLTVNCAPKDATVKILNIDSKFYQGIELSPGKYHVEVSAGGHVTRKEWVELSAGEDKDLAPDWNENRLQQHPMNPPPKLLKTAWVWSMCTLSPVCL